MTTFNDEKFEELVKKANRKRNRKSVLVSALAMLFFIVLGIGGYMFYTNDGLFQGDKVTEVPNGHIKVLEEETGILSLLFYASGGYAFNTEGEKISVYLNYYEKDVRKKHELVGGFEQLENAPINGTLYWGITSEGDMGEPKELRMVIRTTNGIQTNGVYDFTQLHLDNEEGYASAFNTFSSGKIKKGKPYVLRTWQSSVVFRTDNNFFDSEILAESDQTAILYLVFE